MIRTILYVIYLVLIVITSTVFFIIPALLLRMVGLKKISRYVVTITGTVIHRLVILGTGAKVRIEGIEHFPPPEKRDILCLVGNHQSYFDIPLVIGFLPGSAGFVAKKELFRVPFLNLWMIALGCIRLDRSSPRSSVKAIEKGIRSVRSGWPVMIFPEGTRSRSGKVREFKSGSLKLATRSESLIVPLSIRGTADLYEAKGKVSPAPVTLTVHPPIDTAGMSENEKKELTGRLREIIMMGDPE
jgi:1-acyl-sn-glycerol-3-phosphate acyltransferase